MSKKIAWLVGERMTAYDIRDDGGPFPEDGESFDHYYQRVLVWAELKGYDVQLDEQGYAVFYGYLNGNGGNGENGDGTVPGKSKLPVFLVGAAVLGVVLLGGKYGQSKRK